MKKAFCVIITLFLTYLVGHKPVLADNRENHTPNAVAKRVEHEQEHVRNPFAITLHRPNYILPFYYSGIPSPIEDSGIPDNQILKKLEFNFQLSLKVPLLKEVIGKKNTLYLAYTQQSFWQSYNKSAFFRATDYEPELFLEHHVDMPVAWGWNLQLLTFGMVHQSNGRGGKLERSWNRIYIDAIFSKGNWLVSIKPWYILRDSAYVRYNPKMDRYMGHGRLLVAYKYNEQIFSIETRTNILSGLQRSALQATWSFPLVEKVRGYVKFFTGYGQSLIDYNHQTRSIGIGIAINDWI